MAKGMRLPGGVRFFIVANAAGDWGQRFTITAEYNGKRDLIVQKDGIGHDDRIWEGEAQKPGDWIAWVQMEHFNPAVGHWQENFYEGPDISSLHWQPIFGGRGRILYGAIGSGDQGPPGGTTGNAWVSFQQKWRHEIVVEGEVDMKAYRAVVVADQEAARAKNEAKKT